MNPISSLKEFPEAQTHIIVGIRKKLFVEGYEIFARENMKPYLYEFASVDRQHIEDLYLEMTGRLMGSDTVEDFANWVADAKKRGHLL